jgi:hypothetical protein
MRWSKIEMNGPHSRARMQKGIIQMRRPTSYFLFLILAVSFLSAFATAAMADDDPPGRVARLNYIQGSVSFQPGGETDWVQANPNRPLTTGDNLWADRNSRGELHIGSTAIRLSGETGISFLNLDDRTVQIQLAQGSLSVRVRRLEGGDAFEIDTPNLAFTVQRPGEYRFDVDPNGQTTNITVREGEGEANGGGSNFHLDSGESARVSGTDSLTFDIGHVGRLDGFDDWCGSRDNREEHAQSARYVSRDVIGYEDLDDYGVWRSVPEFGSVWFPAHVAGSWAPYRFGHWVWIEPWGWTWVEDEPWGFAPFHYGRWAVVGGDWCWVPGPVVVRPVYAPALVAFVGGPRFNLSISMGGGGGVAWFPLGPREVYVPAYRASPRYVQNVNITNTTVNVVNVTNVYNNTNVNNITYMHQNNVGAVTAVSHDTFVNARPVGAAAVRVNPQQLRAAEVQRGVAVAPVRQSVVGAGAPAAVKPPAEVMNRQVVVKEAPAAPPVSFQRRQQVLSAQPGSVPSRQQMDQLRGPQVQQQQPAGKVAPLARGNQNATQPGSAPAQQQADQQRRPQEQQQQPAGKFTPFGRGNQNASQPGNAPVQQQVDQQRRPQGQPQQPAGKFTPPARTNENTPQPGRVPPPQQSDQARRPQEQPQQPPVKFAPPARVNEDTYRPHPFEKPPAATPPRTESAPPPPPRNEKMQERPPERAPDRAPQRGQESNKPGASDQERKQQR